MRTLSRNGFSGSNSPQSRVLRIKFFGHAATLGAGAAAGDGCGEALPTAKTGAAAHPHVPVASTAARKQAFTVHGMLGYPESQLRAVVAAGRAGPASDDHGHGA